jgi:hypothetical protein
MTMCATQADACPLEPALAADVPECLSPLEAATAVLERAMRRDGDPFALLTVLAGAVCDALEQGQLPSVLSTR